MTTEQVHRTFDVVWSGGDYLCYSPLNFRHASQPGRPLELEHVAEDPPELSAYAKVWEALPGMIQELVARTHLQQPTVYTVLAKMRGAGLVISTKTSTAPVMYARIGA